MSPEQARGQKMDTRTDIFSLGVVLYELVAGRVPFDGETNGDVIAAILRKEAQPLSELAPEIPAEMEQIISRAIKKEKQERYQTSKDLLSDTKEMKLRLEQKSRKEKGS